MTESPTTRDGTAIPEYVQRMVAATNGRMYCGLVGKLDRYPIPALPVPAARPGGLLLDIGCGWGRWMVSAARKGYVPVGVDVKLEAARAALDVGRAFHAPGYAVVAYLAALPFRRDLFDVVWSFSTLQHVHRDRARQCLRRAADCLRPGGCCVMEFPLRGGLWNRLRRAGLAAEDENDPESWCVRYYSVAELRELFRHGFEGFRCWSHCYFGIGLLPVDLRFVPVRYKAVVLASLALTALSRLAPPLKYAADSVYVRGDKPGVAEAPAAGPRRERGDNLDVVPLLRCPVSGGELQYEPAQERLVCAAAGLAYPVVDTIPVLLADRAARR
jgi:SAM-dependent methyltransferase